MKQEPETLAAQLKDDARQLALSAFEAGFKACESGVNLEFARDYFVREIFQQPKRLDIMDMRERIREQCALAQTFADDGAYFSAGRVLDDLAHEVKAHARRVHNEQQTALAKDKVAESRS